MSEGIRERKTKANERMKKEWVRNKIKKDRERTKEIEKKIKQTNEREREILTRGVIGHSLNSNSCTAQIRIRIHIDFC